MAADPAAVTRDILAALTRGYSGNFTVRLVGLTERENDVLLPFLIDHVRSPEFQCRFRWERHSIAFWDNRWVQHYAVADYGERRIMQRVTISGDRPV